MASIHVDIHTQTHIHAHPYTYTKSTTSPFRVRVVCAPTRSFLGKTMRSIGEIRLPFLPTPSRPLPLFPLETAMTAEASAPRWRSKVQVVAVQTRKAWVEEDLFVYVCERGEESESVRWSVRK